MKYRNWDEYGEPQKLNPQELEAAKQRIAENMRRFRLERQQEKGGRRRA